VANRRRRRSARLQTRFISFADHAANKSRAPRLARRAAAHSRSDGGVAVRSDCEAPRHATDAKRLGRAPSGDGPDSPLAHGAARYRHDCSTVVRITSAAAGIVSTHADESFFRGSEPERSGSHTVVACLTCGGSHRQSRLRRCTIADASRNDDANAHAPGEPGSGRAPALALRAARRCTTRIRGVRTERSGD
jgi:hypothetical protein